MTTTARHGTTIAITVINVLSPTSPETKTANYLFIYLFIYFAKRQPQKHKTLANTNT